MDHGGQTRRRRRRSRRRRRRSSRRRCRSKRRRRRGSRRKRRIRLNLIDVGVISDGVADLDDV